jgi:hypothetical protein
MTGRRRTWGAVVLVVAAVALAGAGCKRRAAPEVSEPPPVRPVLGTVTVEDLTPPDQRPAEVDVAELQRTIADRLRASGLVAAPSDAAAGPEGVPALRVRAEVGFEGAEVEDKGVARAAVRLRLETRPSGLPGAIDEDLRGQGERVYAIPKPSRPGRAGAKAAPAAAAPDRSALFAKVAASVAADLIDGVAARERLRGASPAAVHAAIRGDAGDLRDEAIRIAGERKLRDEVPALLELLEDPTESVRDAALGALMAIGDQRAVSALAKSRSFRDHREMRKILEAMATLGGDEALDYLSFVAETHDDPEIRQLAREAKARLERHRGGDQGVAGK